MIHITNHHSRKFVCAPSLVFMRHHIAGAALATLVACGATQPSRRSAAMPDQTTTQNKKQVETLFETFNHENLGLLDELVAPEYVGPQGGQGPAGFRAVIVGLRGAFPDLHYTVDDVLAEGDKVAVRWHWTGTHRAPFRGFPATGKSVSNPGAGIFRCQGGKIVAGSIETDRLGFLEQIGAVPENVGLGPRPAPAR